MKQKIEILKIIIGFLVSQDVKFRPTEIKSHRKQRKVVSLGLEFRGSGFRPWLFGEELDQGGKEEV